MHSRCGSAVDLLSETEGWSPPRLAGVHGIAQPHCHHHAVLGWQTDQRLLADAGADITSVTGCCGLAGNFGIERGHYEVSAQVAKQHCSPPFGRSSRTTSSWQTGSPAVPN